jgi:hypothetical protein
MLRPPINRLRLRNPLPHRYELLTRAANISEDTPSVDQSNARSFILYLPVLPPR